jgi:hypothetical protein
MATFAESERQMVARLGTNQPAYRVINTGEKQLHS